MQMHMHVFVFSLRNVWMMIRKLSANLNYFQSDNTQQIPFQNEVKVRETLCDFEMKIAFRHFKNY